jgi:hypothetical protein
MDVYLSCFNYVSLDFVLTLCQTFFLIDVESFVVKSVRSVVCSEVIMLRDDIRCGC